MWSEARAGSGWEGRSGGNEGADRRMPTSTLVTWGDACRKHRLRVMSLDAAGNVVAWSPGRKQSSAIRRLRLSVEMSRSSTVKKTVRTSLWDASWRKRKDAGGAWFETWRVRKDGTRFMAGVAVTPIFDAGGALTGFSKVLRDLTAEQKRLQHFHALMEAAPDAAVVVGQDGRIALVNAQADRMFRYPRNDLVGQDVESLFRNDSG